MTKIFHACRPLLTTSYSYVRMDVDLLHEVDACMFSIALPHFSVVRLCCGTHLQ